MKQRTFRSFNDIALSQIRSQKEAQKLKEEAEPRPATPQQLQRLVQHYKRK